MKALPHLFENNRRWAERIRQTDPDFFARLARQQSPDSLWIGCSDSRVPANEIVGLLPGELFVHRNVANLVVHTDMNCLSVLQYAVEVLRVSHVIVCGHYGCGGVRAVLEGQHNGLIDNWLRGIHGIYTRRTAEIDGIASFSARVDRLCELNVLEQAINVGNSTILQDAWRRGHAVTIHSWIYNLTDGFLNELGTCFASSAEHAAFQAKYQELTTSAP